jgi:hypothetical protein
MRRITELLGLALVCAAALAQPIIDGRNIPAEFGTPLASQTNYTGFGDRVDPNQAWGSELDQLFVRCQGGVLYIGVTGNLEGNGNAFHFYIDTGRNPNNTFTLTTGCINCSVQGMSGVVFDHNPDWALGVNRYDDGQGNDNIYVDLHDLVDNVSTYLGAAPTNTGNGTLSGGDNTAGVRAALDNSNLAGITSDPNNLGDPATATTGMEVAIPLSALNYSGGRIRILVVLTGGADLGAPLPRNLHVEPDAACPEYWRHHTAVPECGVGALSRFAVRLLPLQLPGERARRPVCGDRAVPDGSSGRCGWQRLRG